MKSCLVFLFAVIACFSSCNQTASSQKPVSKIPFEEVLTFTQQLSEYTGMWIKDSSTISQKDKLKTLLSQYPKIKDNVLRELITYEGKNEKKILEQILEANKSNKEKLLEELQVWKHKQESLKSIDILTDLEQVVTNTQAITESLKEAKNYEENGGIDVFSAQTTYEEDILKGIEKIRLAITAIRTETNLPKK
ncbi:hypothetical protein QNI19_30430 [Cytophagaceae bacterium DM2B3-1]|uniref:Uncharacterized protein n=1 Tax=Xanthocytophaga flava TaxID=3048013 RepID=A0ABT7CU60_9BACT|nr:hypothetical protein [Xanthocytophaga flavus]MDJ1469160.1 hypothetical protein [Xanthocytophaga flavus]MDJ1497294.1 hypothetical protein [Xanthocytophaga flavus]